MNETTATTKYTNDPGEAFWFAMHMYHNLQRNDSKTGWQDPYMRTVSDNPDKWLLRRLREETTELRKRLDQKNYVAVISEAADVANFAMMIADRARRKLLAQERGAE